MAFESAASNLVAADTNGAVDVFVYDRLGGPLERVSVSGRGEQLSSGGTSAAIAGEAQAIAFVTKSAAAPTGDRGCGGGNPDGNGVEDVYVYDRALKRTTRLASAWRYPDVMGICDGGDSFVTFAGNGASLSPSMSNDGRAVGFESTSTDLDGEAADRNAAKDVFLRDLDSVFPTRASVGSDGAEAKGDSSRPSVSGDGRYVAFESVASLASTDPWDRPEMDTNAVSDVFRRDLSRRVTRRMSTGPQGQANGGSYQPSISGDGGRVAFASDASNLGYSSTSSLVDANGRRDVFEKVGVELIRMSNNDWVGPGDDHSDGPSMSEDGGTVGFASAAKAFAPPSPAPSIQTAGSSGITRIVAHEYVGSGCGVFDSSPGAGPGESADGAPGAGPGGSTGERANPCEDKEEPGPWHRIATDRNPSSTARGGPWTPRFQAVFDRAGMSLKDPANLVQVTDHQGPHPEKYSAVVYWRLERVTRGKPTDEAGRALRDELAKLATELSTPGDPLNRLVTLADPLCAFFSVQPVEPAPPVPVEAAKFRPYLRFDSGEKWRPLDVDRFLSETVPPPPGLEPDRRHLRCTGSNCEPLGGLPGLRTNPEKIDFHGYLTPGDTDIYRSPNPACRTDGRLDCDTGPASAIYYHKVERSGDPYAYLDFWWVRFNEFENAGPDAFNHEGDWEGMTIAAPKGDTGNFHYASFDAHGDNWRYLREVLSCDGQDDAGTCGTEEQPNVLAPRVNAYVARGSHATYPRPCDRDDCRWQTAAAPDEDGLGWKSEQPFDGEARWRRNPDEGALLPLPPAVGWQNPAVANWVDWPGIWGDPSESGVRSPGADHPDRVRYHRPWDAPVCSERWTPQDPPTPDCPRARPPALIGASATASAPTTAFAAFVPPEEESGQPPSDNGVPEPPVSDETAPPAEDPNHPVGPGDRREGDSCVDGDEPADNESDGGFGPGNESKESTESPEAEEESEPDAEKPLCLEGDEEIEVPEACRPWLGPFVEVAVCEPDELERSLEESDLGEEGNVEVEPVDGDQAAGSAPGIAQVLGDPLEPGESLPINGEVPPDAQVVVRAEAGGKVVESWFEGNELPSGAELEVKRRPRDDAPVAVVVTPDGETVEPTDVDEVTTRGDRD